MSETDSTETNPEAAKTKPKAAKTKPKAAKTKPKAVKTKPKAAKTKPEAAETNPETVETEKTLGKLSRQFNRVVRWAQAAIFWERLWPRLVPPLCTSALFLSASWAGIWEPLPPEARIAGVITFAAALLASPFLVKTKSLRVTQDDALKRLDENIGDPSRPAQMLRDKLNENNPPMAKKLWDLHIVDMWNKWGGKFKAGYSHPGMSSHDPFRIRYAVIVLTIVTAAIAGEHAIERVTEAFNWAAPPAVVEPVAPIEVKAWVTPPKNINKPTLYLTDSTLAPAQDGNALASHHKAHKNSILTILTFGEVDSVLANGVEVPVQKIIEPRDENGKTTFLYEIQLTEENTSIVIEGGPSWTFEVTPDNAPVVEINSVDTGTNIDETIPVNENHPSIQITCSAKDDYGIQEGDVIITPSNEGDPEATPLPSGKIPPIPLPKYGLCSSGT